MEKNNVNQNVKELTDEQLKKVTGGNGECAPVRNCRTMSTTACECQECKDGYDLRPSPSGRQVCLMAIAGDIEAAILMGKIY